MVDFSKVKNWADLGLFARRNGTQTFFEGVFDVFQNTKKMFSKSLMLASFCAAFKFFEIISTKKTI